MNIIKKIRVWHHVIATLTLVISTTSINPAYSSSPEDSNYKSNMIGTIQIFLKQLDKNIQQDTLFIAEIHKAESKNDYSPLNFFTVSFNKYQFDKAELYSQIDYFLDDNKKSGLKDQEIDRRVKELNEKYQAAKISDQQFVDLYTLIKDKIPHIKKVPASPLPFIAKKPVSPVEDPNKQALKREQIKKVFTITALAQLKKYEQNLDTNMKNDRDMMKMINEAESSKDYSKLKGVKTFWLRLDKHQRSALYRNIDDTIKEIRASEFAGQEVHMEIKVLEEKYQAAKMLDDQATAAISKLPD